MAERLSDAEIRDITKALEDGRPIDDKYRYLIFKDSRQVELVWNGKTTHLHDVVLPFQIIEHIDEPRDETKIQLQQSLFDTSGKKVQGWTNKLIWGDNKYVLSSINSGAIRQEIEENGGIKLIYIDPPFDVGADFSTTIEIGDTSFEKAPTILEEIAFRDTWGQGQDSFLAMIYERMSLLKNLLAEDGSIFVHCDWRLTAQLRLIMDEIFGKDNFVNEIIWQGVPGGSISKGKFIKTHDTILFYRKNKDNYVWNIQYVEMGKDARAHYRNEDENGTFRWASVVAPGKRGYVYDLGFGEKLPSNGYRMPQRTALEMIEKGVLRVEKGKVPVMKRYLTNDGGVPAKDVWTDIKALQNTENLDYPTQKPERLVERIIKSASNENDIVADFFMGSGTTAAVAEKLNRKWISSDIGRFAINTSRKRLIQVQRELKESGKDFRSFEVLSIGSYQFTDVTQQSEFNETVLRAYKAEPILNSIFPGKKANHYVAIGPLDLPASRDFVDEMVKKCRENSIIEIDVLAFEFGMGVVPDAIDEAKNQGVKLNLKIIPREVFDRKAITDGAVKFADVGYLDTRINIKKLEVEVELTDFSIFYSQDSLELGGENLQPGKSRIILDNGIIKQISKSKEGIVKVEEIATSWIDWIDYWAIDFNYEDRRELKLTKLPDGSVSQIETGKNIFENQWQSFRTGTEPIELISSKYEYPSSGKYRIAVKVIDVFGNDTTRIFDIKVAK